LPSNHLTPAVEGTAVRGATLTPWTVAPVIALAATVVATSAAIFAFGPAGEAT
jgi:hypothetical protein